MNDSKKNGYLTDGDAFINPANYSRNANPYLQLTDEKEIIFMTLISKDIVAVM